MAALLTERGRRLDTFLESYLAANMPHEFEFDACCLFAADWIMAEHGFDPAAQYRALRHDRRAARRVLAAAGGLSELVSRQMAKAGFQHSVQPGEGDVGLVRGSLVRRGRVVPWLGGAIRGRGSLWIVPIANGLQWADLPFAAAWSV